MIIYGTVVDKAINVDILKADKSSTYKGYRLTYRTDSGEIRELSKAMASLRYTPTVKETLNALNVGDAFTLVQEKNAAGYFDVKSLTKGRIESELPEPAKDMPTTVSLVSAHSAGSEAGTPQRTSAYQTQYDEKQRLIVRQSCLAQAVTVHIQQNDYPNDIESITMTAEAFEKWVYRGIE